MLVQKQRCAAHDKKESTKLCVRMVAGGRARIVYTTYLPYLFYSPYSPVWGQVGNERDSLAALYSAALCCNRAVRCESIIQEEVV